MRQVYQDEWEHGVDEDVGWMEMSQQRAQRYDDTTERGGVFESGVTFDEQLECDDPQGIRWDGGDTPWSRAQFRVQRDAMHMHYYNREDDVKRGRRQMEQEAVSTEEGEQHFALYRSWRHAKVRINHFQLRHLLGAVTNHEVLYAGSHGVMHASRGKVSPPPGISPIGHEGEFHEDVMYLKMETEDGFPVCRLPREPVISSLRVKHGVVAVGGFDGEIIVRTLQTGKTYGRRVSENANNITNGIDLFYKSSGVLTAACSNNDCAVRLLDVETGEQTGSYEFAWAVNLSVARQSKGDLICVVGDCTESVILDERVRKQVLTLDGHLDFSFAASWQDSDGYLVATGNQDKSARIYDIRRPDRSLHLLLAHKTAVRSLCFSPCGTFLAVGETADYVSIYNIHDLSKRQTVDFFGDFAGFDFSPDSKHLFMGVSDRTYHCVMDYYISR